MTPGENTRATKGDSSQLQGDLNFAFDQRKSEVNLNKVTSSPESPSNVILEVYLIGPSGLGQSPIQNPPDITPPKTKAPRQKALQ